MFQFFFSALIYKYKRVLIRLFSHRPAPLSQFLEPSSQFRLPLSLTCSRCTAYGDSNSVLWYCLYCPSCIPRLRCFQTGPLPSTSMESPNVANGLPARGDPIATPTGSLLQPHTVSSHRPHFPGLNSSGFTLSSNPPNPRTVFRLGDWM